MRIHERYIVVAPAEISPEGEIPRRHSSKTARFEHENEMRRKALKQKKIWNPALYGIRNPLSWNPESSSRNPESTGWNPESKTVMHGFPYMGRKWHERPKWPLITTYYHVIQLSRITYHSHSVYQWNQRDIDTGIFSLWIQTDRYRCVGNGEYHRHSLLRTKIRFDL